MSTIVVYFDLETGGVEPHHPDIQIAASVWGERGVEFATFERKIVFDESKADPEALKMNHYDPAVWAREAIPEGRVVREFASFLRPFQTIPMKARHSGRPYSVARLGGYNAATFDGPRLREMFKRNGDFLPAHPQVLCVMQRAGWWCFENKVALENMRLATVCEHFGIQVPQAHDALADARATAQLAILLSSPSVMKEAA